MGWATAKNQLAALIEAVTPDDKSLGSFKRITASVMGGNRPIRGRMFRLYATGADTWVDDPHPQRARGRDLVVEVFYPGQGDFDKLDDAIMDDYDDLADALIDGNWLESSTGIRNLAGERRALECEVDRTTFEGEGHVILRILVAADVRSGA